MCRLREISAGGTIACRGYGVGATALGIRVCKLTRCSVLKSIYKRKSSKS